MDNKLQEKEGAHANDHNAASDLTVPDVGRYGIDAGQAQVVVVECRQRGDGNRHREKSLCLLKVEQY